MKKLLILLSALSVILFSTISSHSAPYWAKIYESEDEKKISSMHQTADGGYVLAGYTYYPYNHDIWILKLDTEGEFSWSKTWGGSSRDEAFSIQQTDDDGDGVKDDGYVVAGTTQSFGAGNSDVCVLKLSSNGNISWQKTYGGSGSDGAYSIQQTSDGGFIVAGFGAGDLWVLKLNSNGNISWERTYGGSNSDRAYSIQETSDGGYVIAGSTSSFGNEAVWILKLATNGDIIWQKKYSNSSDASRWARSIQQTTDGGYIVACNYTTSEMQYSPWILKLDSNGNIIWQKIKWATGLGGRYVYFVQQTLDGGYIIVGKTDSVTHWGVMWMQKLDSNGNLAWEKSFANAASAAYSVRQTIDGGYVIAGSYNNTYTSDDGLDGTMVSKLNTNGEILDCDLVEWEPTLYTFSASVQDTTITFQPSASTITETDILPQNTSVEIITMCSSDLDGDGIPNNEDNCTEIPNGYLEGTCISGFVGDSCNYNDDCGFEGYCSMAQEDHYPPQGNNCGDACECEGNFNPDEDDDVDGSDAAIFKAAFGRGGYNSPCTDSEPCNGNFDCDTDVDGSDAAIFKTDFGRGGYNNPCPACVTEPWCIEHITGCLNNFDCPLDLYCEKPIGQCDIGGECVERPEICPTVIFPVCGCDGITYSNDCYAAGAGISIDYLGECM